MHELFIVYLLRYVLKEGGETLAEKILGKNTTIEGRLSSKKFPIHIKQ